ncbi:MAG: tetratricopeptide repeat protein [Planctomycetaceae bacterium]
MRRYDEHLSVVFCLLIVAGLVFAANRSSENPRFAAGRNRVEYDSLPGSVSYNEGTSNYPEMYHEAADLTEQGKHSEAEALYRKIIALEPDNALGYIGLGSCRIDQHDLQGAEENYRRAAKLDPKSSMASLGLGSVFLQRDEFEAAIEFYTRALALAPDLPDPHWGLATTYDEMGDRQKAGHHFREFLKIAPDSNLAPIAKQMLARYEARPDPGLDPDNTTAK